MGRGGTALGIIGIIIAAGAIGFAFIVWNGQNTTNSDLDDLIDALNDLESNFNNLTDAFNDLESEFNNMTKTIVVGIWESLVDNLNFAPHNTQRDWLFEFGDNKLNNTDYISVSNTNTRITLLKPGWYRIHLNVLLSNLGPSNRYWVSILKDGVTVFYFDRYEPSATVVSTLHYIDSSAFVYSNGSDYIELRGWSDTDDFDSNANSLFNQLKIEYVAI